MTTENTIYTTNNDDGSLRVGLSAGPNRIWRNGDKIQILGEGSKVRTATYVMGGKDVDGGKLGEKVHLCFKDQGKVPTGIVQFQIVGEPQLEAVPEISEAEAA